MARKSSFYASLLLLTFLVSCNSPEVENVDRSRKSLVGVWEWEDDRILMGAKPNGLVLILNDEKPSYVFLGLKHEERGVILPIEWESRNGRVLIVKPHWWVVSNFLFRMLENCDEESADPCIATASNPDSIATAATLFSSQAGDYSHHFEESLDSLAWYFTQELDSDLLSFTTEECRKQNNNSDNLDGLCTIRTLKKIQLPPFDEWLANLDTISSTEYWKAWEAEVDTTSN